MVGVERATGVLRNALDAALVVGAAELLGIMDSVLEMTLTHLRTRKQFGVAIGSFQVLQHRAVDMWIQREITEAVVESAAGVLDGNSASDDLRSATVSGAKARASQAALLLCNQSLQLHGAIGFADEYELGLYINRALTLAAFLGNAAQHRNRFSRLTQIDRREQASP